MKPRTAEQDDRTDITPQSGCVSRAAFTLIELLVVMTIIAILIGLLFPSISAMLEMGRQAQCRNNLKQISLALHSYHKSREKFPPAGDYTGSSLSWSTMVLPFLDNGNLYDAFDQVGPYHSTANKRAALTRVELYLCPSSTTEHSVLFSKFGNTGDQLDGVDPYTMHYYGILGPEGTNPATGKEYDVVDGGTCGGYATGGTMLHNTGVSLANIHDGKSNTYLLGELSWDGAGIHRTWARGTWEDDSCGASASAKNIEHAIGVFGYEVFLHEFNDASFGSMHPGGTYFVYAGGSVHFVNQDIDLGIYKSMASRDGSESVTPP